MFTRSLQSTCPSALKPSKNLKSTRLQSLLFPLLITLGTQTSFGAATPTEVATPTMNQAPTMAPEEQAPADATGATPAPAPGSREYHLKAAFLRYVARYIEWPKESIKDGILNICVLGQVPNFQGLKSIDGKIVNDLTLVIKKTPSLEDAKSCQLVFVSKTEEDAIPEIIKELSFKPILSFGDMPGFAERGGAMNFYIANNRLAIMVNLPPIEDAKLKINPQMLRLVTIVPPPIEDLTSPLPPG